MKPLSRKGCEHQPEAKLSYENGRSFFYKQEDVFQRVFSTLTSKNSRTLPHKKTPISQTEKEMTTDKQLDFLPCRDRNFYIQQQLKTYFDAPQKYFDNF